MSFKFNSQALIEIECPVYLVSVSTSKTVPHGRHIIEFSAVPQEVHRPVF